MAQRKRGYREPKKAENTHDAAEERVWTAEKGRNTQSAVETRVWIPKRKYSTQTKKKNMKK